MSRYNIELDLNDNTSHSKILKKISSRSRVLEFGPAHGVMTKFMKEVLECKIFAVELDSNAALDAGKYCEKIVVGSIEDYKWADIFKGLEFDYIIFADVLEHLYDPWKVLKEVKPYLSPKGRLLISLPNIAHNAIIMSLLNDNFEYRPTGLLDNTHIRFFAKQSIDAMIEDCGYKTVNIDATFVDPEDTEFKMCYSKFNNDVVDVLSNRMYGHVYQYIYDIEISSNEPYKEKINEILTQPLNIQLYMDTGSGFNNLECVSFSSLGNGCVDLVSNNIIGIRFDPEHKPGVLNRAKFSIIDENNELHECSVLSMVGFSHNISGGSVCITNDPQIILGLPNVKNIKSLVFDVIYKPIRFSNVEIEHIVMMNRLKAELVKKNNELSCIYNSKSWFMITFMRKIKKFLTKF